MTLSDMDYWRLADELTVVDAAILITGNDPSNKVSAGGFGDEEEWLQDLNYEGYEAAFKALRHAILGNRLQARFAFPVRKNQFLDPIHLTKFVRMLGGHIRIFASEWRHAIEVADEIYIQVEPCWEQTTVEVEALKPWLDQKGIHPPFFFPEGKLESFRDQRHPRYSPKLACAVAAWEKIVSAKPNMSVKATLEEWVRANAVMFEMVGNDGLPTNQAVEQVSAVANWAPGGGANPTPQQVETKASGDEEETQNFDQIYSGNSEDYVPGIPF